MLIRTSWVHWALVVVVCACDAHPQQELNDRSTQALDTVDAGGPPLEAGRLLRRTLLSLQGRAPTWEEFDAFTKLPTDEARDAALAQLIDESLNSVAFYKQTMLLAHDWFGVGAHNMALGEGYFTGHLAIELQACPVGTLHAGKLGLLSPYLALGDPESMCDSPTAPVFQIEPWWAAGTMVSVIGRAGSATPESALRTNGPYDCGQVSAGIRANSPASGPLTPGGPACGCGPHLVYCIGRRGAWAANSWTQDWYSENSPRRAASEEVARLFAHLVWHDRPLSDFLTSNYTVASLPVRQMYVRAGRTLDSKTDDVRWWDPAVWSTSPADPEHLSNDPLAWHEVVVATLFPKLLSLTPGDALASGSAATSRSYTFDPRSQPGEPLGIPAAGALTSLVANASFPRERVRAARWLEALTCRAFVPPPPNIQFNEYHHDPAREGGCQHCHVAIDPAAMHFKRWSFGTGGKVVLGGIGAHRWATGSKAEATSLPYVRWAKAFDPVTALTPITTAQLEQNPDARFIDFLPPDQRLFGATSDGTIGPLGFGKLMLASGEFDRCAAQRLYERFVGPKLTPQDDALITELTKSFVDGDRKVRPFIKLLLKRPENRRGL